MSDGYLSPNSWDQLSQQSLAKAAPAQTSTPSYSTAPANSGGSYGSGTFTVPGTIYGPSVSQPYQPTLGGLGTLISQTPHYTYPIVVSGPDGVQNLRIDCNGDITTRPNDFNKVRMTDAIVSDGTNKIYIWDVIFGMRGVKNNGRTLDASCLNMIEWIGALNDASKLYQSNPGYAGMGFHEFAMKVVGKPKRNKKQKVAPEIVTD
jgi:hypothetical protein